MDVSDFEATLPPGTLSREADAWTHRAGDLITAARLIWDHEFPQLEGKPVLPKPTRPWYVHLMGPFFMLAGLAITRTAS
jgi:hypothetical protein